MKIRPVGAELFHVDGQTDRSRKGHDVANSRFFANAPTNCRVPFRSSIVDDLQVGQISTHFPSLQNLSRILSFYHK